MDFYKYLNPDFCSQHFLFTFCASKLATKWAKSVGNSIFCLKNAKKSSKSLDKSWEISKILDNLDKSRQFWFDNIWYLIFDKNLAKDLSQLKSLDFKNLDLEIKNFGLDMMDNLNKFQKLVSTLRTILISILIGLDCQDPQA